MQSLWLTMSTTTRAYREGEIIKMKVSAESSETGLSPVLVSMGVMGVSFRTARIEIREMLARNITTETLSELKKLHAWAASPEFVLVATCNRTEIYYFCRGNGPSSEIQEKLGDLFRTNGVEEDSQIYHYVGRT